MAVGGVFRAGAIVALITFAGRVSGLARELALARSMGVGSEADVAVLLMTLPDLLTQVLAAGAISSVLIPVFQVSTGSLEGASHFRRFSMWALAFGAGLAVLTWAAASGVVWMLAPGFAEAPRQQAVMGLRIVSWTLPLTAATAVAGAWLHAQSRFGIVAAGTLLGNVVLVVVLLGWPRSIGALGMGLIAVSAVRWGSQLAALGPRAWQRTMTTRRPVIPVGLGRRYLEAAAAAAVVFLAPLVVRSLASLHGSGGVAVLNYATRVLEVPMGLALGVVPTVVFPRLSAAFADRDADGFHRFLTLSVLAVFALSLPMTAGLAAYGDVAARVVFAWAGLDQRALEAITGVIAVGSWGLPAFALTFLLQSALNSRLDTRGSLIGSGVYLVVLTGAGALAVTTAGLLALVTVMSISQWLFAGALLLRLRTVHGINAVPRQAAVTLVWLVGATVAGFGVPIWWTADVVAPATRLFGALTGGVATLVITAMVLRVRLGPHALVSFRRAW